MQRSRVKKLFGCILNSAYITLLLPTILIYGALFHSSNTSAIAKASTISLSLSTNNLSLDLKPSDNGTFGKSGSITVNVGTDNYTGYTLSIISSNSPDLEDGNGNSIESIGQSTTETNFSSSQDYNNQWGYIPSKYVTSSNGSNTVVENDDTYLPAPSTSGDNLDITSSANTTSNTYTIGFGARVDTSLPSGAYSNSFSIVALSNSAVYNITYDKNTPNPTDAVSNMPTPNPQVVDIPMSTSVEDSHTLLSSSIPTRDGYTFAGWCDVNTTLDTSTNDQTCSGTTYQAGGDYGIDQTQDGTNIQLFAIWQAKKYNIPVTLGTGISSVVVKQNNTTVCTITNGGSSNTCSLSHGVAYDIIATPATGYNFNNWNDSTDNTFIGNTSLATTTYTPASPTSTLTATATAKQYTITLNANNGTAGSTSSTATYNTTTLSTITNPTRSNTVATRTVSGFTLTNSGANATVSSTATQSSTSTTAYTFNGWYKEAAATNKIASNATTPVLQPSTSYTDANGKWTNDGAVTLYAGWTSSTGSYSSVTLPTITRTGSTCGWSTSSTATTITYASGASITPTANTVLYGVCVTNITLDRNGGNTGSTSATVNYGATSLSSITVPTRANSTGTRTVSGFTKTTSATNATVSSTTTLNSTNTTTYTFNGWHKDSGTGTLVASTASTPALTASNGYTNSSKQWTYTTAEAVTLYAGWDASAGAYSSVTLPTITRTGSTCGWSTSSTATTITYASGASVTPTANTVLYGVCVNNITLNKNGATNSPTTSTTVNYGATSLNNIATLPTRSYTISGFTVPSGNNASGATVSSTSTLTSTYTFNGWYKESGATNKIASNATTPALEASTTYTNASKQWTYTTAGAITLYAGWTSQAKTLPTITKTGYTCGWTTTSTGATTITYASGASLTPTANTTLYGVCVANQYTLTVNPNGGSFNDSTSTTTYTQDFGTLKVLPIPTRTGYTFNGWSKSGSGTVTKYGVPKFTDETFSSSRNGMSVYNNSSNGNVTHALVDKSDDDPIKNAAKMVRITTTGAASPGLGGFVQSTSSYENAVFYHVIVAKIPVGYTIINAQNATGNGRSITWLTPQAGTGEFEVYIYKHQCGSGGSFSTFGHVYLSGTAATSTNPVVWDVAYANIFNATTSTPEDATQVFTFGAGDTTLTANWAANTYTVTLNQCSATTNGSTSAIATYYSTTLSSITLPQRAYTISFTNNVSGATASSTDTLTSNYTFGGWVDGSCSGTTLVASNATTPALQASVSGYTDSSKRWTRTSGATLYAKWTAQAKTLPTITKTGYTCGWYNEATDTTYASGASITPSANISLTATCTAKQYTITLNKNGATNTPTASTTVTYDDTKLGNIATLPTRSNSTATRTVSGFTLTTSGTNATVSSTTTLNSTQTTSYTFNGWYKESAATNKIAGTGNTPTLETTTDYTTGGKWTNDGAVTLYAGWTASAGNYSAVTLPTITRTGSTCGWSTSSTATTITYASGASFTPTANTTLYGVCVTNITLDRNGGNAGSTSTTVNYNATTLGAITVPTHANSTYTVSGFTKTTSATNSTVSSTSSKTSTQTYTFNGWYKESGATNKIASNATTPALEASTTYTNASKQWTYTTAGAITLYAGWTASGYSSVTLPTITRTGSTCGWSTSSTATTITYASGASITPTANTVLYGVCVTNISLDANGGTGGSTSTTVNYNATTLGAITVPTHANSTYTVSGFTKTTSATNSAVSSTSSKTSTQTYTFNGWHKDSGTGTLVASTATTPALTASNGYTNSSKQWTYTTAGAVTLYAGWTASGYSSVTLPTITRTGSTCGWSTSSTATTITYASGASITPTANTVLYGVCVTNITLDRNGGNTGSTSATVNYGATSLSSITVPTRANSTGTRTVSGFTKTTSATNATVSSTTTLNSTNTTTYTFNGWHKDSGTGTLVASTASTPALTASNGYTNSSKQWTYTTAEAVTLYAGWDASAGAYSSVTLPTITRTGSTCGWSTSSTATTITYASGASVTPTENLTLYGVCVNNITLNANGATSSNHSTSTTATYNATTLGAVTVPTRSYTISGFTLPSSNNADSATVTYAGTSCTSSTNCKSTYSFNGWHQTSGTGTLIASSASTPALQASTTYTNSSKQWTYTTAGAITLYAGWDAQSVVLPTITKTGYTCGWTTTATNATTIAYDSGSSITPAANTTLYGVCIKSSVNIAYDGNNADAGTMGAVGTGVIHTDVNDGDTVNLIASNFSRTGYGFAGWSLDSNAGAKLLDNDNTNNPVVYGPQESVTLPEGFTDLDTDNDGIVKLYAVWLQSQGNLQGWMGCNSLDTTTYDSTTGALDLTKNSVTALTDQRDNDTYAVARLADGKCWMIENLRLESTNSDNSTGALAQGYGASAIYGDFSGLADSESKNFAYSTAVAANSLYYSGIQDGVASIDIGTTDYPIYRMPRYNNANTSTRASNPITNDATIYSYGNYYTWHAAIADLTYNGTNNKSSTVTSLCPEGWHLPIGGSSANATNSEFWQLGLKTMGVAPSNSGNYTNTVTNLAGKTATAIFRSYPYNFLYSGLFMGSKVSYRNSSGLYWSSTAYGYQRSYDLSLSSSSVQPGTNYYDKYGGLNIRCVASDPETYVLTYDTNGGSGAPNSPEPIYANGSATFAISSTAPTRSGYTFDGWMDEKGNEVQAGGTLRTKETSTTLYAIWTNNSCNPTATTIGTGNTVTDAVCLQDVKPSMKASLPTADATNGTYTLIDARDGQSYTVAKLADEELWLTKNLNYGSTSDTLLTSYDTDLPSGNTFKAPASTTAFETANNTTTYVIPKILTDSTYGGYYSYAAAIASTNAYSTSGQNISTSICPKGWDLPTSAAYNNLRTVSGNTSFAKISAAPYSFIYAGYRNGTSFTSQTSALRLWTSTNYNASYAYYTTAYSTASYSGNYKRYGESVRCIASNGTATVNYYANGGSGSMASQTNIDINSATISANSFTAQANRQFRNWNTKADGTGTTVAAGALLSSIASDGDTINLYAQWDEVYYIAFNANQGTGTMTNQTVVRGTATAIKTSTFTRSGYIFLGWNTAADGTGTFYGDGQSVTDLTTTGNTITLYAVWVEGAYLDTGQIVNQKLKRLAGNSSATYSTQDYTITAIARSNTLPDDFAASTENTISDSSSPTPIYAWYDSTNTTIYYYSTATNILLNKDSSNLFRDMRVLSNLSTISSWDTSKVTNMSYMLQDTGYSATTFTLDLSSWNTASVTTMSSMFYNAGRSATTFTLDLSSWDTSSVTNMNQLFASAGYSATAWSIGDLSSWDTSSVTNMSSMLYSASYSATTWFIGDLSSWDTSSVTDMSQMFYSAGYSATTWSVGDLSSWNTASVTDMFNMFAYAGYSATTWSVGDLSSWNTASVTNTYCMFFHAGYSATTWSVGNLSSWNTVSMTSMSYMFSNAGYNATTWSVGNLSSWNTSSVTDMSYMFFSAGYSATTWSVGDLSSWNTASVTNMSGMFYSAGHSTTTWSVGDLSSWNTSSVTDMYSMFDHAGYNATTWSVGDLSSWDTSSVTNMSSMFSYAGYSATTWSVTIPKTNNGTATGAISNTTTNLYGSSTSVTATPPSGRSFTLAR